MAASRSASRSAKASTASPVPAGPRNEVILVGRLSAPVLRRLPSGDEIATFRIVVDRDARDRGPSGRVRVDALDCSAFTAGVRRRVESLPEGCVVEVVGRLRRRFWRGPAGATSITEVEARSLRRVTMVA